MQHLLSDLHSANNVLRIQVASQLSKAMIRAFLPGTMYRIELHAVRRERSLPSRNAPTSLINSAFGTRISSSFAAGSDDDDASVSDMLSRGL